MRVPELDRVAFGFSAVALAFLYGIATQAFGWFPSRQIERAWEQAEMAVPYLTPQEPAWLVDRVHERSGARVVDPQAVQPGVTLIAANFEAFGWKPGLKLVDREGRTLHEWRIDSDVFPDSANRRGKEFDQSIVNGSHLFPDGDVVVNLDYVGTVRLDACGEVVWRMPLGNHHSVARAEDGSFWIPAVTGPGPAASPGRPDGLPGLEGPIFQDRILHVSGDGELLEEFNVLDLLYDNGLARQIRKASWKDDSDLTHLNDVEPLPAAMADAYPLFEAGDLLVSLRYLDLVFVFDPDDGRVKWHASDPFLQQHDPDFMGDGWIGVFDNNTDGTARGTMLGGSRIVAVRPHTDSTRVLFPTPRSDAFYTAAIGQWQRLENGNLLLTESGAGRVLEAAPDGRTVWEWVAEPYSDARVPEIPDATRYGLTAGDVTAWPCSPGEAPDATALDDEQLDDERKETDG